MEHTKLASISESPCNRQLPDGRRTVEKDADRLSRRGHRLSFTDKHGGDGFKSCESRLRRTDRTPAATRMRPLSRPCLLLRGQDIGHEAIAVGKSRLDFVSPTIVRIATATGVGLKIAI